MEQWKPIEGFPDFEVADDGRVRNLKTGHYVGHKKRVSGFRRVTLTRGDGTFKCFFTHRLVALAFVPNPNGYKEVQFLDRDKENCSAANLAWAPKYTNRRTFTPELAAEARAMFDAGVPMQAIVDKLHFNWRTIDNALRPRKGE